jgi:Tfp pilus assembly protein PilN
MGFFNRQSTIISSTYTIDLLKGEGLPIQSRPGGVVFACLLVVVPLLVGIGAVRVYMDGEVVIAIQKHQLSKLEAGIEVLSGAVQKKQAMEKEKAQAARMLSDVKSALGGRTQWSPTLASLVESLSDTLVLTKLEARQGTTRGKVPAKDDPARKIEVSIPVRELKICVCGKDKESSSEAVRKLQESLRSCPTIGPMLDTITVSQDATTLESQQAALYELNCVFKPAGTRDL